MPPHSSRAGLKAAIASAGVVALMSTGAAFAASGHAPWSGVAGAGRPATLPSQTHATDDPSETAGDEPSRSGDTSAGDAPGSEGSPDAHAYPGLCRAYAAGQKDVHGNAWASPAFAALVAEAGGTDNVADFCAALVPSSGHPTHPVHPTHPAKPTHPAHPAHPTHPAKPTHPAHPAHPTHPAKPAHPAHPDSASTHAAGSHPVHP